MSSIGDLVVHLGANTRGFDRGIDKSQSKLRSFASGAGRALKSGVVAGIGAATVATAGLVRQMGKLDEIAKLSQRSGLDPRFIAAFGFAAEQSGSSVESANRAIDQFTRRMGDAAGGSGASAIALGKLGMSVDSLMGQSPEQQFMQVAEAISQLPTAAERADAAYQLFGRSGQELVNVLATGEDGLRAFKDEAESLGLGFDASEIGKIEAANDAMNRIKRSTDALFGQLAVAAAPAFEQISSGLMAVVQGAKSTLPGIIDTVKSVFHGVEDVVGDSAVVAQVIWDQYPQIVEGAVKDIPMIIGAVFDWVEDNSKRMLDNIAKVASNMPDMLSKGLHNLGEEAAFQLGLSDERQTKDVFGGLDLKGTTAFKLPEFSSETSGVVRNLQESLALARKERAAGRASTGAGSSLPDVSGPGVDFTQGFADAAASGFGDTLQTILGGLFGAGEGSEIGPSGTGSGFAQKGGTDAATIIARAFNANRGEKKQVSLLEKAVGFLGDIAAPNTEPVGPKRRLQES